MTKKFSIKKLVAGVLAAAMVVTALPVSGLMAKAAESDVWTVYRSYNPNDGEHLMTVDAAEHKFVVAQGRTDEGAAWTAPKTSKTPVYRVYNPNSGEHLLVPQGEAEGLATIGWSNEGIKMYSDDEKGVPIYRVFNPNATDAGAHLYTSNQDEVKMLVAAGWSADNNGQPMLYGVGEDLSAEVTLVDRNGLQSNGTALDTDTLAIVFGSSFGVPKSVVWYKDGAVIRVKVDDITTGSLQITPLYELGTSASGDYYAVVENTNGKSYKTNTITVVEEGTAVISAVSINDNYDALAKYAEDTTNNKFYAKYGPVTDTETDLAVINVKFNKYYNGAFYVVEGDAEEYGDIKTDLNKKRFIPDDDNTYYTSKKNEFSDVELAKQHFATSSTGTAIQAICLENKDGSAEWKILSGLGTGNKIERGSSYKVIYDQTGSVKPGSAIKDWNVSTTVTCPYLYAPTKVVVTDPKQNTAEGGWTLTAYMGDTKAGWISSTSDGKKVTSALYTNDSASTENGAKFSPQLSVTVGGVGCTSYDDGKSNAKGTADKSYVYGTMTIAKGICGEKELTLTSAVCMTPDKIAEVASVAPSSSDAKDMDVTLSKLRADAVVYLVGGSNEGGTENFVKDFDASNKKTYIASAELKKGTTSYTFDDAVEKFANKNTAATDGDNYYVIVVPKDSTSFARTVSAKKNIKQTVTTYALSGDTKKLTTAASTAVLQYFDQYGTEMKATGFAAHAMGFTGNTDDSTDEYLEVAVTANTGAVTISIGDSDHDGSGTPGIEANIKAGDKYTYKISSSQTITLKCTQAVDGTHANAEFTITVE